MTSRERLLAAMRRRPVDRLPVTLYEIHDFGAEAEEHWAGAEPSYRPLLELQRALGDTFVFAPCGGGLLGDPNAQRSVSDHAGEQGEHGCTRAVLQTPLGELSSVSRRERGLATTWVVKHFIEGPEDARRFLSIEPRYEPPRLSVVKMLQERVGERGVLNFSVGDPLGHVVGLWDFQQFVLCCYEDLGLIREMLDRASAFVAEAVRWIGQHFRDVCVRFWGPEYCGAPLMDPHRFFQTLVVDRVNPLVDLVHAGGNLAILHCHGMLDAILEQIAETGADVIEPLELRPVKTADVTMAEVRRRVGGRMCLAGGMQALDLDAGTPELVSRRVRSVVDQAGTRGLILLPTSAPIQIPLPGGIVENYRAMFETAASISP